MSLRFTEEEYEAYQKRTAPVQAPVRKPSKFSNKKIIIDGITFDSKREANRYTQLKVMEKAGAISDLERQVKFTLVPTVEINGEKTRPMRYYADFVYKDGDRLVVEDVKGMKTDVYKIKRILMKHVHGIEIREV